MCHSRGWRLNDDNWLLLARPGLILRMPMTILMMMMMRAMMVAMVMIVIKCVGFESKMTTKITFPVERACVVKNPIESVEKNFIERSNFKAGLARRRPINRKLGQEDRLKW